MAQTVMDKIEALEHLTGITRNGNEGASARISAIRTAAELQDWMSPTKVQVLHLHELLGSSDEGAQSPIRTTWQDDAIDV